MEENTLLSGTLVGAGEYRCNECDYVLHVVAPDEIPTCPSCGAQSFERTLPLRIGEREQVKRSEPEWLIKEREQLDQPGEYLIYVEGDSHQVITCAAEQIRLGRSMTADVRLDDPTVSRRHAIVLRNGTQTRLIDDRSLNGVFVNGRRVQTTKLEDGDEIAIGRYSLHFITVGVVSITEDDDEIEPVAG